MSSCHGPCTVPRVSQRHEEVSPPQVVSVAKTPSPVCPQGWVPSRTVHRHRGRALRILCSSRQVDGGGCGHAVLPAPLPGPWSLTTDDPQNYWVATHRSAGPNSGCSVFTSSACPSPTSPPSHGQPAQGQEIEAGPNIQPPLRMVFPPLSATITATILFPDVFNLFTFCPEPTGIVTAGILKGPHP